MHGTTSVTAAKLGELDRSRLQAWLGFRKRLNFLGWSFLIFVALPSVACFLYLALIASKEYVSEARFAVRTATENRPSAISDALIMLSNLSGGRSTTQDAFIVADYIRSRTIIEHLGGKAYIQSIYSLRDVDWLSRLPSNEPLEDVWTYWRKKVSAIIDTQSTIVTLRVVAFRPEDAKDLAEQILRRSELLVNEISDRSRRDTLTRAEAEVQLALQRLAKIRAELLGFRGTANTIDPVSSATSMAETLTILMREKLTLENNRTSLKGMMSDDSPTIRFLSNQIDAIGHQITALQERLTGQAQGLATVAGQIANYEEMKLQSQFAEKLFEISQASFERARLEQVKQQMYLVTVVQPTLPEEPTYPRPLIGTAMVFSVLLVIWSMIGLVFASIRDHVE